MRNYFKSNCLTLLLRLLSVIIISVSISCLLFSLLPKLPSVQASLLINDGSIAHSSDTEHEMIVLDNGRLANRYYVIAEGNDKIDLLDKNDDNITNTMIAIRFDQHSLGKGADIAGEAQSDFVVTSPITRHKPSIISGYSEDTETVYASKVLSYQVTQRTLAITDSNCVIMELIIENTDQSINDLTHGRLLYKVDFDAGLFEKGDKGFYDETRRLIYHTDYHGDTTGSAIGVALLTGELKGYGLATDNLSVYPSITSTMIEELEDPTETIALSQAEDKNLAGWLVVDIPTPLQSGEKETLAFGWCAAVVVDPDGAEEEVETEVGEDLQEKIDSLFGLSIDKFVTPYPTVNAGEVLTYTIVVANQGRGDINGIAVSDILPDQTTLIPGSIQVDLPNSGIKGTTLPDLLQEAVLQPDEFLTVTYAVMVDQTTEDGMLITNEAAVTSNQTPAPITSSVTSIVRAKPNLDMRKFATPTGPVMVGQLITFTIVVSNSGHGPAEDLVITDNLPPSLQFKPGSISLDPPDAGVITGNQPGVVVRDVRIPPVQRVTATIAATVTNHGINGVITNTAYAAASVSDTITIPVEDTPVPILSVTKQASGPQIAGIPFTYTITVTNSSPTEEATGVIIEDTLPIGAEYLSGGNLEDETVIWEGITVPANGTQTVAFSVKSCQSQVINQQYRVTDSDQVVNSNWGSPLEVDLNEPTFSIDFTSPVQVSEDETVLFNSQTATNGSNIVNWKWDFGYDGNTGDGQTVSHTFANPGNYEVTLIVTDACNYEASVTHSISVESGGPPPPTAIYLPVVLKNYVVAPDLVVTNVQPFGNDVQVTIKNVGNTPVTQRFWTQVYINPHTPPTAVSTANNKQRWQDLGDRGISWNVTALPLVPGETLTLRVGDSFYDPNFSNIGSITPGTVLYAQVDVAAITGNPTNYGAILESHEIFGTTYNNIPPSVLAVSTIQIGTEQTLDVKSNSPSEGRLP